MSMPGRSQAYVRCEKCGGGFYTQSPLHKILSLSSKPWTISQTNPTMAPQISEDEIDDLVYFARVGETGDMTELLTSLAEREKVAQAVILMAAKDNGQSTALHMATGNGHLGMFLSS